MIAPDALQVLVISHATGAESGDFPRGRDYVETIRNSFIRQETHELVRELSLVDEQGTGAAVRRFYVSGKDPGMLLPPEASELANALHTLVVLLVTTPLVNDDAVVTRMAEIARAVGISAKRHGFLLLGTSEEVLSSLLRNPAAGALKEPKGWSVEKLGEYALRPAYAAMLALNKAHQLLAYDPHSPDGLTSPGKARFFISHAKLDGLPLAQSLSHTIAQLPWLAQFYDAKDIQSGDDFKEVLERGVLGSMLLVLRTDIYDLRFWCRQEVMWADSYDRPVLLVDARTELLSRASVLGFTGIPGVRIPDGNLVRVLMEGLREWVRIGVLHRRYVEVVAPKSALEKKTELLSRTPTLTSLAEAIKRLKRKARDDDEPVRVVYAEPPLESNHHNAAQDLIRSSFRNGAVLSFKSFLAQLP
jgi:hypothetical protein